MVYQCEDQKLIDSYIVIKRRLCKNDLNFMNSGVSNLTIALIFNRALEFFSAKNYLKCLTFFMIFLYFD